MTFLAFIILATGASPTCVKQDDNYNPTAIYNHCTKTLYSSHWERIGDNDIDQWTNGQTDCVDFSDGRVVTIDKEFGLVCAYAYKMPKAPVNHKKLMLKDPVNHKQLRLDIENEIKTK